MHSFRGTLDLDKIDELKPFMVSKKRKMVSILYGIIVLLLVVAFFMQENISMES